MGRGQTTRRKRSEEIQKKKKKREKKRKGARGGEASRKTGLLKSLGTFAETKEKDLPPRSNSRLRENKGREGRRRPSVSRGVRKRESPEKKPGISTCSLTDSTRG